MRNERKKFHIPMWAIIFAFLLVSGSGWGFLLMLPFVVGGIIYYFAKKAAAKDDERTAGLFEIKKREESEKSRERAKALYSESEFEHLSTMKSGAHSEYEHYKNELDDLLAAGIIEREEYRERVANLRAGR